MPNQSAEDKAYQAYLDDHAYQQYLAQHRSAAPKEALSAMQSMAAGNAQGATLGYTPQLVGGLAKGVGSLQDLVNPIKDPKSGATIPRIDYGKARDATQSAVDQARSANPGSFMAGEMLGAAPMAANVGGAVAKAGSGMARIGASSAAGGLEGLIRNPGQDGSRTANAAMGMGVGAAGQSLGEGASKAGDYLMQKAVGMKKYMPGVGKTLADEGIMGTKGSMQNQVQAGIDRNEDKIGAAISQLKGDVNPEKVAEALKARAAPFIPKPGSSGPMPLPSENQPFVKEAYNRAEEAFNRGPMSPEEALSVSRAVAKPAYNPISGTPLNSFSNQLNQTEGASLKETLKSMAEDQGTNSVRQPLAAQAALYKAQQGLDTPTTIPKSLMGMALHGAVGAGAGGAIGGYMGGGPGALAGALAGSSLGQSGAGRAAIGAGKAVPYMTPELVQLLTEENSKK